MPVYTPKRRPAFKPLNRLRAGAFGGGKKGMMVALNLTAMVDMFTVVVIFLLQSFSANGEVMFVQKDITLPEAKEAEMLSERGPVVTIFENQILVEGEEIAQADDLSEDESGIPELTDLLSDIKKRDIELFQRDPNAPFEGHVIIQADNETDFMLVRKAIFSVNQAGWYHLQFVVIGTGGAATEGGEGATEGATEEG